MKIKDFFSTYALQLMGGALAVSLLANVGMGIAVDHYASKAASCKANVVAVNKAATEKKEIVEKRQEKNIGKSQDRTSTRIADATRSLRDQSRQPYRPSTGPGTEGPTGEGGTPVVLPEGSIVLDGATYANDQRICVVNTIKAEEWQLFYQGQVNIWEEENVGNPNP